MTVVTFVLNSRPVSHSRDLVAMRYHPGQRRHLKPAYAEVWSIIFEKLGEEIEGLVQEYLYPQAFSEAASEWVNSDSDA